MDGVTQLQQYFQILGDTNRLKIINFINKHEKSVSEIVIDMQLSQPLVSHHLRILKESQILETKRVGPFIYYRLKDQRLLDVLGLFTEILPKDVNFNDYMPMFMCPPWVKRFFENGY
jgi:DNA-binding transcriptional ArsR family regulator